MEVEAMNFMDDDDVRRRVSKSSQLFCQEEVVVLY